MILNNGKFTYARFVSSRKQLIDAIWHDDVENKNIAITLETDLTNPNYVKLLETFSVDEISTMTDQHTRKEALNFELFVKDMAQKYGLLYDPNAKDQNKSLNVDSIFAPPEGDAGTDLLFNIKLKIFEMQQVTDSTDTELKKKLREATTPLEALYIAGKFLFE